MRQEVYECQQLILFRDDAVVLREPQRHAINQKARELISS